MFKGILKEFKTFALKGNVLDMAVGIIIGASFSKIVDSLVKDVLMPPLGMLLGKVDFSNLKIMLGSEADAASINYGLFLNTVISFIIVAMPPSATQRHVQPVFWQCQNTGAFLMDKKKLVLFDIRRNLSCPFPMDKKKLVLFDIHRNLSRTFPMDKKKTVFCLIFMGIATAHSSC